MKVWISVYRDEGENYVLITEKDPVEAEWDGKCIEKHEVTLRSDLDDLCEVDSDIEFSFSQ